MATNTTCEHANTFFDESTNDFICKNCGLVRIDFAFSDNIRHPLKWSNANKVYPTYLSTYGAPLLAESECKWNIDMLERVCGNFHISKNIEHCVMELLHSKKYVEKRGGRRNKNLVLLAHAFYEACIKHGCPKSMETVASYFQVEQKSLWNAANEFDYSERKLLPSDLLPPLKTEISSVVQSLSHRDYVKIANTADRISNESCNSPSVILAVCILLFLKNKAPSNLMTMKSIAKICNVSCTSVSNLRNKLQRVEGLFN